MPCCQQLTKVMTAWRPTQNTQSSWPLDVGPGRTALSTLPVSGQGPDTRAGRRLPVAHTRLRTTKQINIPQAVIQHERPVIEPQAIPQPRRGVLPHRALPLDVQPPEVGRVAVVVADLLLERDVLLEALAPPGVQVERHVARDLKRERHAAARVWMRCGRLGRVTRGWETVVGWARTPIGTESTYEVDRKRAARFRTALADGG